jgi:hypothetical protein
MLRIQRLTTPGHSRNVSSALQGAFLTCVSAGMHGLRRAQRIDDERSNDRTDAELTGKN